MDEHRAERREWPLEPLDAPEVYLSAMARNGLPMLPLGVLGIVLIIALPEVLKVLGFLAFGAGLWFRVRYDRVEGKYHRSARRSNIPDLRDWALLRASLRNYVTALLDKRQARSARRVAPLPGAGSPGQRNQGRKRRDRRG